MTISRNLAGLTKIIQPQTGQVYTPVSTSSPNRENFQNVLKSLISDEQKTATTASGPTAINQEQLQLLVRAMQIQMNSRLYNTLLQNGLESNMLASQVMQKYGGNIAQYVTDASNNSQATPKKNPVNTGSNLDGIIQEASAKFKVDENLIRSVIRAESNFNPAATSSKGAMGLMQLMPETAKDLGVSNAYDARENVMGGTRYLKTLLDRYGGQVDLALAAYNWGMGNVEKKPHQLPQETINYVAKVTSYYKDLQA